jgi:hypothetical protein
MDVTPLLERFSFAYYIHGRAYETIDKTSLKKHLVYGDSKT